MGKDKSPTENHMESTAGAPMALIISSFIELVASLIKRATIGQDGHKSHFCLLE